MRTFRVKHHARGWLRKTKSGFISNKFTDKVEQAHIYKRIGDAKNAINCCEAYDKLNRADFDIYEYNDIQIGIYPYANNQFSQRKRQ